MTEDFAARRTAPATSALLIHAVDQGLIVRNLTWEKAVLSSGDKSVLRTFQQYLVTPGKMLCFFGPNLEKHKSSLQRLTEQDLLVKEQFKGAYSLTNAGFEAMKTCDK